MHFRSSGWKIATFKYESCTRSPAGKSQLFSTKVARDVSFRAPAGKSQLLSTKVVRQVNFRCSGWNIATFAYRSSTRSKLSQLRLENRNFKVRKCFARKLVQSNLLRELAWRTCSEEIAPTTCSDAQLRGEFASIAGRTCRRCYCFRATHLLVFFGQVSLVEHSRPSARDGARHGS